MIPAPDRRESAIVGRGTPVHLTMIVSILVLSILPGIARPLSGDAMAVQQRVDPGRASIHRTQSALHQWDELKIDSSHAEFLKGKAFAQEGNLRSAAREFKKGLRHHRSYALFDLGLVASAETRYTRALSYFRSSYRVKKDKTCLEEIRRMKRLIREHLMSKEKKADPR